MPSEKKRITVYPDEITHEKITKLAEMENRSLSNYVQMLIKKDILKYELEHGEIVVKQ